MSFIEKKIAELSIHESAILLKKTTLSRTPRGYKCQKVYRKTLE